MKQITIGNYVFDIKDYYCSLDGEYLPKEDGKLWLYINITDVCNGSCPFCINPCKKEGKSPIQVTHLKEILNAVKNSVYGVSITGGEPLLDVELLDSIMDVVTGTFDHSIEIDMVTNGVNFEKIPEMRHINDFDSVHLSRHCIDDNQNAELFGFKTPTIELIKKTIGKLKDPGKIVFNCTLQTGGIDTVDKIAEYLEMAAYVGVQNTSFIGLSKCNKFCENHFVNPADLNIELDNRFQIWNKYKDYDFCCCSSGDYQAKVCSVRFYYRCIGNKKAPYARQLVYTADNRLLAGFGGEEITIL